MAVVKAELDMVKRSLQSELEDIEEEKGLAQVDHMKEDWDCILSHMDRIGEKAKMVKALVWSIYALMREMDNFDYQEKLDDFRKLAADGKEIYKNANGLKTIEQAKKWVDNLTPEQVKALVAYMVLPI